MRKSESEQVALLTQVRNDAMSLHTYGHRKSAMDQVIKTLEVAHSQGKLAPAVASVLPRLAADAEHLTLTEQRMAAYEAWLSKKGSEISRSTFSSLRSFSLWLHMKLGADLDEVVGDEKMTPKDLMALLRETGKSSRLRIPVDGYREFLRAQQSPASIRPDPSGSAAPR